jgi:hypothetical protein
MDLTFPFPDRAWRFALLCLGAFLPGRCARGKGVFRFFGFVQDQEQPIGLSRQTIHATDEGKDKGEEYQKPQTQ